MDCALVRDSKDCKAVIHIPNYPWLLCGPVQRWLCYDGYATELLLTFTDGLEPPEWPDLYAAPPPPPGCYVEPLSPLPSSVSLLWGVIGWSSGAIAPVERLHTFYSILIYICFSSNEREFNWLKGTVSRDLYISVSPPPSIYSLTNPDWRAKAF